MSISENTRSVLSKEVTIRYIAPNSRNNSATGKSNDSSAVRSFTTSTCSNPPGIAESSHLITLEDNKEDEADGDAFDSAKEVDEEEENESKDEQHVNSKLDVGSSPTLKCRQNHNDDDDLDEKVAMECKVVKQDEYEATADDAPLPLLDTATFSTDQAPDKLISKANLKSILTRFEQLRHRHHSLPFLRFRLIFAAFLFAAIFMLPSFLTGFITGLYISFLVFLFLCVSDPMAKNHHSNDQQMWCKKVLNQIALKSAQQEKSGKIYKGWMNILNEHYHPHTFHVNTIQTVLVRLDGNLLRICRPELKMLKHAFHVDPTLTETEPRMVAQSIYDLTGATVKLRPQRLARRRWFSRKYPICIKLAKFDDGAGTEVGPGAPMATHVRRPIFKKQSDADSAGTSTLPEEAEAAAGEEQRKFATERKTIARMQMEPNSESDDLSELSDAELPLRHSLSDFTLGSNGHPAKRQPKKRRQSGRYIFLFGRSAREKERWFHKLRQASSKYTTDVSLPDFESTSPRRRVSFDSLGNLADRMSKDFLLYSLQQFQFTKQMELLLGQMSVEKFTESDCGVVTMDLGLNKWTRPSNVVSDHFVLLVNLLATRVFYDFCRDKYWCEAVRNKIQTKLATIHLPYFIETLEISTFDLGTSVPKIVKVFRPTVDQWGIWCDFEIKYHGLIKLGLETRVNLMKLKSVSESMTDDTTNPSSSNGDDNGQLPFSSSALRTSPSRYSDEEMPESPETSPDEEFGAKLKEFTSKRQKTGQKILSLVDRFTHSKYFREAVELRPVRKMMEEISSTRLMLNVEVTELEGTMTANLAAPPSDRLWYAFRTPPQMSIKAIPQVGERSVVYSALSEWIENKLQLILEKNLVLPNMDDVVIPIMSGNQLLQGNLNR